MMKEYKRNGKEEGKDEGKEGGMVESKEEC